MPNVNIQSAEIADPRTVRLRLKDALQPSTTYSVTCSGIRDDSPRHNLIGSRNSFTFTPQPELRDGLKASLYTVSMNLRKLPDPEKLIRASSIQEPMLDLWFLDSRKSFIKHNLKDNFLVILEGNLEVPFDHEYEFSAYADDALRFVLDGRMLFELDSNTGAARGAAQLRLQKGYHPTRIVFLQRAGGYLLNLYWSFPFHEKQRIPWNYLCSENR